jgi:hypothetical protein
MELSIQLKHFYGECYVRSYGVFHHIYPANDKVGLPLKYVMPSHDLESFALIHDLTLKNMDTTGADVYKDSNMIGTVIIHMF